MKIYTRTGDSGTTALFGGERVPKTHSRIAAYGTVDEVNSFVGLARAHLAGLDGSGPADRILARVQADLFVIGADLATPSGSRARVPRATPEHVAALEKAIDELELDLEPLKRFILPGGSAAGATLHVARTVCRRAERLVLMAAEENEDVSPKTATYLNRLSDLLFVIARWVNVIGGQRDEVWEPDA